MKNIDLVFLAIFFFLEKDMCKAKNAVGEAVTTCSVSASGKCTVISCLIQAFELN